MRGERKVIQHFLQSKYISNTFLNAQENEEKCVFLLPAKNEITFMLCLLLLIFKKEKKTVVLKICNFVNTAFHTKSRNILHC